MNRVSCILRRESCIVNRASCIVKRDGVTLIELLVVLAIIGIIAAIASIDFSVFQREGRVTEIRDRLLTDIEDAKIKSISDMPHGILIVGGTGYSMNRLPSNRDTDGNFIKNSGEWTTTYNWGTWSHTNVRASGNELWFARKGVLRDGGGLTPGHTFRVWYDENGDNAWTTIETIQREITLSNTGRIQYEQ
ncbi:MAG: prepilin-type N-terminal cleavage/methylation domain-containing protein [Nitrospirae bacterium]|nr:prepilin-type N-terminal cleavage/methylation domain-containing protein [Nitrospirota bacterium]